MPGLLLFGQHQQGLDAPLWTMTDKASLTSPASATLSLPSLPSSTARFLGQEGGFQRIHVPASWGSVRPAGHAVNNIWQQLQPLPTPDLEQSLFAALRVTGTLRHRDVTRRLLELTQLGSITVITSRNICILSSGFLLQKFITGRFKCFSLEKASSH